MPGAPGTKNACSRVPQALDTRPKHRNTFIMHRDESVLLLCCSPILPLGSLICPIIPISKTIKRPAPGGLRCLPLMKPAAEESSCKEGTGAARRKRVVRTTTKTVARVSSGTKSSSAAGGGDGGIDLSSKITALVIAVAVGAASFLTKGMKSYQHSIYQLCCGISSTSRWWMGSWKTTLT